MSKLLSVSALFLLLAGCAGMRALIPGGVTAADMEFSGVKAGQPVPLFGTIDPKSGGGAGAALLEGLVEADLLGSLMPVKLLGAEEPRWILCTEKFAKKCREIPLNAEVHVAGQPVGAGMLWRPTRLTAANFDD